MINKNYLFASGSIRRTFPGVNGIRSFVGFLLIKISANSGNTILISIEQKQVRCYNIQPVFMSKNRLIDEKDDLDNML
jgi:hypothetical protein